MSYKLRDLQAKENRWFWDGVIFKKKEDIRRALISYHGDVEGIEKLPLTEILEVGGWELEEV